MNERIKELAEQAGYYLYDLTETHECKTVETDSTDEWITLEKFAQLIVQDCLAQVARVDDMLEDDPAQTAAVAWVALSIAQHFGVEHS